MKCSVERVEELRHVRMVRYVLSMGAPVGNEEQDGFEGRKLGDSVADTTRKSPEEAAMEGVLIERLQQLISEGYVSERNGGIILARLGGRTQKNIGDEWGITGATVRQICKKKGGKLIEMLRQEMTEEREVSVIDKMFERLTRSA